MCTCSLLGSEEELTVVDPNSKEADAKKLAEGQADVRPFSVKSMNQRVSAGFHTMSALRLQWTNTIIKRRVSSNRPRARLMSARCLS